MELWLTFTLSVPDANRCLGVGQRWQQYQLHSCICIGDTCFWVGVPRIRTKWNHPLRFHFKAALDGSKGSMVRSDSREGWWENTWSKAQGFGKRHPASLGAGRRGSQSWCWYHQLRSENSLPLCHCICFGFRLVYDGEHKWDPLLCSSSVLGVKGKSHLGFSSQPAPLLLPYVSHPGAALLPPTATPAADADRSGWRHLFFSGHTLTGECQDMLGSTDSRRPCLSSAACLVSGCLFGKELGDTTPRCILSAVIFAATHYHCSAPCIIFLLTKSLLLFFDLLSVFFAVPRD